MISDANLKARVREIEFNSEVQEAEKALKLRAEKMRLRFQAEREQAEIDERKLRGKADILKGRSLQELITLVDDETQREHLLELNRQMAQAGMTPEQILAQVAASSPQAADALARMRETKREDLEREFRERKQVMDEAAARLERVMSDALKSVSQFAQKGGTTINRMD